ncbi:MAG TPA: DUF6174 domain-containing protein [Vicinamibacterales bacterium]|nr:DUF6174 domain-containing protein [Vicinamibacterales bacterium]
MISLAVLWLFGGSVQMLDSSQSRPPIEPVAVTARRIEGYPDPGELNRLKHEALEAQTRVIEREELAANRKIWSERKPSSYRFTVASHSPWGSGIPPVTVTIRDGRVVSSSYVITPRDVEPATASKAAKPFATVPRLFELIEELLDNEMSLPHVHYDEKFGFPANVLNNRFDIADDEYTITVWDFQVLD